MKKLKLIVLDVIGISILVSGISVIVYMVVLACSGLYKLVGETEEFQKNRPCADFQQTEIINIPARCMSYFQNESDVPYFRNDAQEFDQYPKDDMDYGQLNLK